MATTESRHDSAYIQQCFPDKTGSFTRHGHKERGFYVWFCTCSFLRLERLYGNGKGHLAFRREGRSCCLVVVVLCVLGYPEWSRAFTCPTLAERGVLVIALASSCICVLAPLQDGGRLLRR